MNTTIKAFIYCTAASAASMIISHILNKECLPQTEFMNHIGGTSEAFHKLDEKLNLELKIDKSIKEDVTFNEYSQILNDFLPIV